MKILAEKSFSCRVRESLKKVYANEILKFGTSLYYDCISLLYLKFIYSLNKLRKYYNLVEGSRYY
jgi:hypothetical protein